jgi:hypothetical protein
MSAPALAVLNAVIDEWAAFFPGTPERQMDAITYLADIRDAIKEDQGNPALVGLLSEIFTSPRDTWSAQLNVLCKQDGI